MLMVLWPSFHIKPQHESRLLLTLNLGFVFLILTEKFTRSLLVTIHCSRQKGKGFDDWYRSRLNQARVGVTTELLIFHGKLKRTLLGNKRLFWRLSTFLGKYMKQKKCLEWDTLSSTVLNSGSPTAIMSSGFKYVRAKNDGAEIKTLTCPDVSAKLLIFLRASSNWERMESSSLLESKTWTYFLDLQRLYLSENAYNFFHRWYELWYYRLDILSLWTARYALDCDTFKFTSTLKIVTFVLYFYSIKFTFSQNIKTHIYYKQQ